MLADQVAYLLERYLGNYVKGLSKEALKISVWQGDLELTNMQLKPEALNALKLPVKVKAGFLGSVKVKVPWSRLGQDPVLVYLDCIFILAAPGTQVDGCTEDAIQEAKKSRVREMELRLLERAQQMKLEMNKSWMGSLINTVVGNLKLSISNIHIRYEDLESNPGQPFAAGVTLEKLSTVTIDDSGKETFVTSGGLDCIQKAVELDQLALYMDSNISPWCIEKPWEDLLPSEWVQIFKFGIEDGKPSDHLTEKHTYILQPISGNARYSKKKQNDSANSAQPLQKAAVNLDDVILCLPKDGYANILKLADSFDAFNKRLKYAHYRPLVSLKSSPRSWWKYAYQVISDQIKKESGKLSWEQVLRLATLRKRYISLYASLLKSDLSQTVVDNNKEIEDLDRDLDIDLILQWRMLSHKFVEKSVESDIVSRKQNSKQSWWSFGWNSESSKDENEPFHFSEDDWERLNEIIGYKEEDEQSLILSNDKADSLHTNLEIHMKHNASKLLDGTQVCLAELSCKELDFSVKMYPETMVFDMKLGSYRLSSPNGLLAESATDYDSLVGVFCYKPFDAKVDWRMTAKASPCYMTYLKDSIDQIVNFFESDTAASQTIALETAAAVKMTIDDVKRSAQQQVNQALKDHTRFLLDLDIAAPKIMIPTDFRPDNIHSTKLLLDLGNLVIHSQDANKEESSEEMDMYLQFHLVLSDISAFLVDGDYSWSQPSINKSTGSAGINFLPVLDECGVTLKLQQIRIENPSYPSTRISVRLPSLGFHISPARYHRLMQIAKIFQEDNSSSNSRHPWNQADFEGWLSLLTWKGVGYRDAAWKQRYLCLVGPFLYVLQSPGAQSYKQYLSLRGKQVYQVPPVSAGGVEHVLAICDYARSVSKVVEDVNALIIRCDSDDSMKTWRSRLQAAIYRATVSASIPGLSESSSDSETELNISHGSVDLSRIESVFITGVLDELRIRFSYNNLHDHSLIKVLLAEESHLIEFRAIGGQVELSIIADDMFIGTVLKSLEVEDLVSCYKMSQPCYLARSFIGSENTPLSFDEAGSQNLDGNDMTIPTEGDDKFYEAPEDLVESLELQTPGFDHISGLLPGDALHCSAEDSELTNKLHSFVKAQIIIYDQSSSRYNNIDTQIVVTLATLSFFCRRPTILAMLEFVNAININDDSSETLSDDSLDAVLMRHDISGDTKDQLLAANKESVIKGLLGKGKSRIIFNVTFNMVRAQILLMNENDTMLTTLSQDNLLTDIKVYPSSFSIKSALGNLKISDDSLPSSHLYFWICDMRNPGGSSFVELVLSSFSVDDEDYEGYDYSLFGQLSEVRIVFLNRFVQEIVSYFMGLVPENSRRVVKIKDQGTDSEKSFTTDEIEGSPALKLDLSLRKPIILMPRRTDSLDYLKLDIDHITVQNTFQWFYGSKNEINAVHLEVLTVLVEDINLNVGSGNEIGESIIQDVKGVAVVVRRSLRDLLHKIPSTEAALQIEELKAVLSDREYQIITDCVVSNFSETPHEVPQLNHVSDTSVDAVELTTPQDSVSVESEVPNGGTWIAVKVSVVINLVELCLHTGVSRDATLATVQASGAWLLYTSDNRGGGFLSATLKGFSVIDDRDGTDQEFRLAIGMPDNIGYNPLHSKTDNVNKGNTDAMIFTENSDQSFPTMLILDAKFSESSTFVSLCVQRPQLLVALDFLLAVVEFFVPTVGSILSNEDDNISSYIIDAIILDQSPYYPPSSEMLLSPEKPLIVDDERFHHFVYDGKGGVLQLNDRQGFNLSAPSIEPIIFVGNGKKLQFKNVTVKNGQYLDSCILLGSSSSYSASKDDQVYFVDEYTESQLNSSRHSVTDTPSQNTSIDKSTELIVEFQAIGPELTFYNISRDVGKFQILSNMLLHAELDVFSRLVMKGDAVEITASAIGLTMESNGITILEPFDTSVKYSNASGKTNIHLSVSDIFMNISFSILKLFLAVQEDILSFLRMTSKKMTMVCSEFDKVGMIKNPSVDQVYTFWRPHVPPGFAVLGDYLTPLDKPPTKGVISVNTNLAEVKRPISFKLIWPPLDKGNISDQNVDISESLPDGFLSEGDTWCSIWLPEAPEGYVALGCVVSEGQTQPPLSAAYCILASLVSPCSLRDCITINLMNVHPSCLALWRVDNSVGTFLPADPSTLSITSKAYELRHIVFGFPEDSSKEVQGSGVQVSSSGCVYNAEPEGPAVVNPGRRFEAVASFQLVWWNQGSSSRKKLSIWRPVVPQGMVYFGDIVVAGYEPPNTSIVLHDTGEKLFKVPLDFQLVGQIKKQKGMGSISFWMPQAPPGLVSLGCIACRGSPKQYDFSSLRCMRSDLVNEGRFLEESIWDSSDAKSKKGPFSIWMVRNELGTFIARSGFKRPPRRFALKLADPNVPSSLDASVIDADMGTISIALFDDYGGLMVPLFNISLSRVGLSSYGRTDFSNSTINFSLAARSYNDTCESWEPLVEPVDGFLRYQYDLNSPGAASQLRLNSTRDLNLNVSASNANMMIQAYANWSSLSQAASAPAHGEMPVVDVHSKKNYYIIPQNKLGLDIFFRAIEIKGLTNIIRMPSGDMKPIKVPVSKNMLESHLEGRHCRKIRTMVTIIIVDAQFPKVEGLTSHQYSVAISLTPEQSLPSDITLHQQSVRTRGGISDHSLSPDLQLVKWNEIFFFKVDSPDHYIVELMVTDIGKGDPVGFFSAPLNQIAENIQDSSNPDDLMNNLTWIDLSSAEYMSPVQGDPCKKSHGRIRCAVVLSPRSEVENGSKSIDERKYGFIQISPNRQGPWTTVRINYAAPAACWRFGNDVVASEVRVKDGNRYVNIRSLASARNKTDIILEVCLTCTASNENIRRLNDASKSEGFRIDDNRVHADEFFETEKYDPTIGWVGCLVQLNEEGEPSYRDELPSRWEWIDDWNLDTESTETADGWVYAVNIERLKWPESSDPSMSVNCARQRRWIRHRKHMPGNIHQGDIYVGELKPGETLPLSLSACTQYGQYAFRLRPSRSTDLGEYSWSSVVNKPNQQVDSTKQRSCSEIYVSTLTECEELLCCTKINGSSSNSLHKMWFCVKIQATEIAHDMYSNPIQDWSLVVKSPFSISNLLPFAAECSVLEKQISGHLMDCSRGIFRPGTTVKVYNADIRNPLFFSLVPQRGWKPVHEAVLVSDPRGVPSKTYSLRSLVSRRIVELTLEQNNDADQPRLAKRIRVYSPYWFTVARCPPLTFRLLDMLGKKSSRNIALPFRSKKNSEAVLEEISQEEIGDGHTIDSTLNFNFHGLSISMSGTEQFGPVKDLSPLGDMDGSLDLFACDANGNCMRLFISRKTCPYQSVPTKVISVRPFMTFTNRCGEDIYIKLSSKDEPKVLHPSDSRVSVVCREMGETHKLQVRLEDTKWSFPFEILKEDTISLVMRTDTSSPRFLRMEIRGYEEGSRFIVVFRVGCSNGPIRIENRTTGKTISICQFGFSEDAWVQLQPLSTTIFCWEDPYGQKFIHTKIEGENRSENWNLDLEKNGICSAESVELGLQFHVVQMGDVKVARFQDHRISGKILAPVGNWGNSRKPTEMQNNATPMEIIIVMGIIGVSIVDHKPREVSYVYLERVLISYSTGYDGGATSRFKLILGYLQLDNQLPLTLMPVLLAPQQLSDISHPVFKMTVTVRNENVDGIQIYPYVYVRVTDKCWRINIHEPIIWAVRDFYNNLQLDRIPQSSSITQVDPEIRFDLIDVSEVRLKVAMETAPAQRPQGVLGVWSPIFSAVGNAFKIKVHVRRMMHKDRFMFKSSIVPAIRDRLCKDLVHNPLHLIFSVDVLGMTSSTLASLSKGFAKISTDGQFLMLRSKQVRSRKILGVADGIIQGTEAFAQGLAFGVSGVVTKPMESARQNGIVGLAQGLGRAVIGIIVQPVSGALDFVSLTVDGIGASCSKCFQVLSNKATAHRVRNPRAIRTDGILGEYSKKEAAGQMILYLAEESHRFACAEIFKEPSKFALSDYYEEHFVVPYKRIVLVTNKQVILLQCLDLDTMDKKPCKITWYVPWEDLMAIELAKAGSSQPTHLMLHLKSFRRSDNFVRIIKCNDELDEREAQAVRISLLVRKMWKAYQADRKCLILKVPSSQKHVHFAWSEGDGEETSTRSLSVINSTKLSSISTETNERRFVQHTINFVKIWSSEVQSKGRCILLRKQVLGESEICSIWRPICPEGYVFIGDIARVGSHPPNVAAVYHNNSKLFAPPVGYDLVWRNCSDDYTTPVSIWHPRAPEGFVSLGCIVMSSFAEPELEVAQCVAKSLAEGTVFEQNVWSAPESYPWACHVYQIQSDALHFVALRQHKEESHWKPMRVVLDHPHNFL